MSEPGFTGEVSQVGGEGVIYARYLVRYEDKPGHATARVLTLRGVPEGNIEVCDRIEWTKTKGVAKPLSLAGLDINRLQARFDEAMKSVISGVDSGPSETGAGDDSVNRDSC